MVRTFGRDKIKVETEAGNPENVATEITQKDINETLLLTLLSLQDKLKALGVRGSGSNNLQVDIITGVLASITTLSTLTNANNLTNIDGVNGWVLTKNALQNNFNNFINAI